MADEFDLSITVGGDTSAFQAAMDSIPAAAQAAAGSTQQAFDALGQSTQKAEQNAAGVADALRNVGGAAQTSGAQAQSATAGWMSLTPAIQSAGQAAQSTSLSFADIAKAAGVFTGVVELVKGAIGALKDLATEAVTTGIEMASAMEKAQIAITAMTKDSDFAADSIKSLETVALSNALDFKSVLEANQKLVALGFSATQARQALQAAADAAAAVGLNFAQVSPALDRIAQSGSLVGRQLVTVGLTLQDVAKAMGTTTDQVRELFKQLDPGDRLNVLIQAEQKYAGTSAQIAKSLSGEWQNFKTEMDLALAGIGTALTPVLKQMIDFGQANVVPAIQAISKAFNDLGKSGIGEAVGFVFSNIAKNISDFTIVAAEGISEATRLAQSLDVLHITGQKTTTTADELAFAWKQVQNPFALTSTEIQLMNDRMVMANGNALILKQRFVDITQGLTDFINKSSSNAGLMGLINDSKALDDALTKAKGTLDIATKAMADGKISTGEYEVALNAFNKALYAVDPSAKAASDALKSLDKDTSSFEKNAQALLDSLPSSVDAYTKALSEGGKTVHASLSSIATDIDKAIELMTRMKTVPNDLLLVYGQLKQAQDRLNGIAQDQSLAKISDQIAVLVAKYPQQIMQLDGATQQWIASMLALSKATVEQKTPLQELQMALEGLKGGAGNSAAALQSLQMAHEAAGRAAADHAGKISTVSVAVGSANFVGPVEAATKAVTDLAKAETDAARAAADMESAEAGVVAVGSTDFVGPIQSAAKAAEDLFTQAQAAAAGIEILRGGSVNAAGAATQLALGIQQINFAGPKLIDMVTTATTVVTGLAGAWDAVAAAARGASAEELKAGNDAAAAAAAAASSVARPATGRLAGEGNNDMATFKSTLGGGPALQNTQLGANGGGYAIDTGERTGRIEWTDIIGVNTLGERNSISITPDMFSGKGKYAPGDNYGHNAPNMPSADQIATQTAAQLAALQQAVATDQTLLASITALYQSGQATAFDIASAQRNLQQAQDALTAVTGQAADSLTSLGTATDALSGDDGILNGLRSTSTELSDRMIIAGNSASFLATANTNAANTIVNTATMTMGAVASTVGLLDAFVFPQLDQAAANGPQGHTGGITPLSNPQATVPSGTNGGKSFGGLENPQAIGAGPVPMVVNVTAGSIVGAGGVRELTNLVSSELVKNLGTMGIRITRV